MKQATDPGGDAPVPIIDITSFTTGEICRRADVAETIRFVMTGHGFPESLVTRIYDVSRAFFDLPAEEKNRIGESGPVMGGSMHFGLGKEALAATLGGEPVPDLKETLDFGPGFFGDRWPVRPPDLETAPFDDNNVRLALKHAIDREEMVEKILFGYGVVGNDHPIGPGQRFFAKDLEQRVYDPDKAKHYLMQAGMDSLSVSLSVGDAAFAGAVDAGALFAESAKAANINLDLVREPNDGYWKDVWNKKPFCACYWAGRATADWMFSTAYEAGVPWNGTQWERERFNMLLKAARAVLDESKRREMYAEMQQIVRDEGGPIIPMFASYVFATSEKLALPEQIGSA